jgi:Arc/MetJ family transcription regulator
MYRSMHTEASMRTTLNLDDELLSEAQRLTGMTERTALIHAGLRALIERESARRLTRLGATERSLRVPSRRRAKDARMGSADEDHI